MHQIAQLLIVVVELYAAIAVMGIGFAMMFGGKIAAQQASHFFVLRPLIRLCAAARDRALLLLALGWSALLTFVVMPMVRSSIRGLHWLIRRERG